MAFPSVPQISKRAINSAGSVLIGGSSSPSDTARALDVLGKWRACHAYPINTFQATLRKKLKLVDRNAIVAQRLKRMPTIIDKLRRFPQMQLVRMQDIGGVRAIVGSVRSVRSVAQQYREKSRFKHQLVSEKDYISNPKDDGYRGIHLIYRYQNPFADQYNGLLLELQIRTSLQHSWSTAVEAMGTFLGQALKSRQGDLSWRSFFAITGSAFAYLEQAPLIPGYALLSRQETFSRVADMEEQLGVLEKMRGFSVAVNTINENGKSWHYHLVILDSAKSTVEVTSYSRDSLKEATNDYSAAEKRAASGEKIEPVLVSAGPLDSLRRAYPNYFLDMAEFIKNVERVMREVRATTQS